jgi:hypothetical protein
MRAFFRWRSEDGDEPDMLTPSAYDGDDLMGYYVVVLRDDEVERIAQRVVELMRSENAAP